MITFYITVAHHLQHRMLCIAPAEQRLQGQRPHPHHPVPHSSRADDTVKVSCAKKHGANIMTQKLRVRFDQVEFLRALIETLALFSLWE